MKTIETPPDAGQGCTDDACAGMCHARELKARVREPQSLDAHKIAPRNFHMILRPVQACLFGLLAWSSRTTQARPHRAALIELEFVPYSFDEVGAIDTEHTSENGVTSNETRELSCLITAPSYDTLSSIDDYWKISSLSKREPHKRLLPLSKGRHIR